MNDFFSMRGRTALITGASMSIGRALAVAFARQGAAIGVHYAAEADAKLGLPDAAAETVEAIRATGAKAAAIEADLADPDGPKRAFDGALAALGQVDILVVCASVQTRAEFAAIDAAQIEREVRINFTATIGLMQRAIPPMRARKWGRVLTVGSVNQTRPEPQLAVYAALKSAQFNLSQNLAAQCVADGVMINNLSPGIVETERNRWRRKDAGEWAAIQAKAAPLIGRAARPEEMVGPALLLCSDAASYIAGIDLPVTAGAHLPAAR